MPNAGMAPERARSDPPLSFPHVVIIFIFSHLEPRIVRIPSIPHVPLSNTAIYAESILPFDGETAHIWGDCRYQIPRIRSTSKSQPRRSFMISRW